MIYLINGTDNQYDTDIERAALTMLATLNRAEPTARLVLMKPELNTPAWLRAQKLTPQVLTLPAWLQENAAQDAGKVAKVSLQADTVKTISPDESEYWQAGRRIAVAKQHADGTQTIQYFDSHHRIVSVDELDERGSVDFRVSFDDAGHRTAITYLAQDGVVALRQNLAEDGTLEFFQAPKHQIVAQTSEQLWAEALQVLVQPQDIVISFRREYDQAVLALNHQAKRLAYVYRAQPADATAFDALLTRADDSNLDWLAQVRG